MVYRTGQIFVGTRLPSTALLSYRTGRARRVYPAVSALSVDVADGKVDT